MRRRWLAFAPILLGCSAQLRVSTGDGSHCYTGSANERRCFDTEQELKADFRHQQQLLDRARQRREERAVRQRDEQHQDAIEEAQIRQHKLEKQQRERNEQEDDGASDP